MGELGLRVGVRSLPYHGWSSGRHAWPPKAAASRDGGVRRRQCVGSPRRERWDSDHGEAIAGAGRGNDPSGDAVDGQRHVHRARARDCLRHLGLDHRRHGRRWSAGRRLAYNNAELALGLPDQYPRGVDHVHRNARGRAGDAWRRDSARPRPARHHPVDRGPGEHCLRPDRGPALRLVGTLRYGAPRLAAVAGTGRVRDRHRLPGRLRATRARAPRRR